MAEENSNVVADAAKSEANTQASRVVRAKAGKMISKGAGALTKNVTSKVATQAAKAAAGLASGGASLAAQAGLAALQNADKIVKNAAGLAGALTTLVGSGISAAAPTAFSQMAIAFVAVPATVAFFLVIINTGAYIVPPGGGIFLTDDDAPEVYATDCPLVDGRLISTLWGSYNASSNEGHGSIAYWRALSISCDGHYNLPQRTICAGPVVGSTGCRVGSSNKCPYYGYAADFISNNTAVYLPTVGGQELTWNYEGNRGIINRYGETAVYTDTTGVHSIILTHVQNSIDVSNAVSGTRVSTLAPSQSGHSAHLHMEYQRNGIFYKPETYFCQ